MEDQSARSSARILHAIERLETSQNAQTEFLSKVNQGLSLLMDGLHAIDDRLVTIETELTKEIPPSKATEVIQDLVDAVIHLTYELGEFISADEDGGADELHSGESVGTSQ